MTAAYRLKGVGWFGTCVAVVLAFYLVSLQVAAERKRLDGVNARIASAARDIRALETEFETRANLAQLEKWNGDTLALAAPTADQFVADETALASIDTGASGGGAVQTAALVVPALAQPAAAPAIVPGPAATAPARPVAAVQFAAITAATPRRPASVAAPAAKPAAIRTAAAASTVAARPQVAMLDRKLLSDGTLTDLLSGATREAGRLR